MRELGESNVMQEYEEELENQDILLNEDDEDDGVSSSENKRSMEYDEQEVKKKSGIFKAKEDVSSSTTTQRVGGAISWLESFLNFIDKFGIKRILQGCLLIALFLVADFAYNAIHNDKMIDAIASRVERTKEESDQNDMQIRKDVGPHISNSLVKLLYSLDADRAVVFENHNGKENATALPFVYFDMTYEEINEKRIGDYVSEQFVNLNISYFKIPYYLVENTYFIGDVAAMRKVDNRFANRLDETGCKYVGLMIIKSQGINIGMLGVMYNEEIPASKKNEIHARLTEYSLEIAPLLDLTIQKNLKNKVNKKS